MFLDAKLKRLFNLSCFTRTLQNKYKYSYHPCKTLNYLSVYTISELKLTGNILKGSRSLLSFDKVADYCLCVVPLPGAEVLSVKYYVMLLIKSIVEVQAGYGTWWLLPCAGMQPSQLTLMPY